MLEASLFLHMVTGCFVAVAGKGGKTTQASVQAGHFSGLFNC